MTRLLSFINYYVLMNVCAKTRDPSYNPSQLDSKLSVKGVE